MGGNGANWDVWNHYHCIYGLYDWYRLTGNETALKTAIKAADYVYDYFVEGGKTFDSAGSQTMNLGISHVFALLYQFTGDTRYLNAAKQIIVEDWPKSGDWLNNAQAGKEYYESKLPRWEALHTIITLGLLYEIEGDPIYYNALEDIWWSIAKTDRHNDGGFTSGEQAVGDPYNTGAIETCCTAVSYTHLSRIQQQSYFFISKRHGYIRFYGHAHDPAVIGVYTGGHIHRQDKGLRLINHPDALCIVPRYFSGKSDAKNSIHYHSIFRRRHFAYRFQPNRTQNSQLRSRLGRTFLFLAGQIHVHRYPLFVEKPGHRHAVSPVISGAAHHQYPLKITAAGQGLPDYS